MGQVMSMDKTANTINPNGRWAPLSNVALCARAIERALNRSGNLPGFVAFTGFSGYGKSMAASWCANKYGGFYVECRSHFTSKSLVGAILKEMDIRPARTLSEMVAQATEQLDLSQRPLILDDCDHLVTRNSIEIVRDIHDEARTAILLIGEENFPKNLLAEGHERIHNRVLKWELAQPASESDAAALAAFYCPGIAVASDLLDRVCQISRNVPRRICVSLDNIREHCQKHGKTKINLDDWGKREIYSGEPPPRRPA